MFKLFFLLTLFLLTFVQAKKHDDDLVKSSSYPSVPGWNPTKNIYPSFKRDQIKFIYPTSTTPSKKIQIGDPYHLLEKDPKKSKEVEIFIDQQIQLTNSFLNQCKDFDKIQKSFHQTLNYIEFGKFSEWGPPNESIFIFAASPNGNGDIQWFMATQQELDQAKSSNYAKVPGKMILDEASLSKDGSLYIKDWQVSSDKKVAAYTVSGGKDRFEIRFMDLEKLSHLPDVLPLSGRMSFIFTPDNKGLIYDKQNYIKDDDPNPNRNSRILYHKLGTNPKNDILLVKADSKNPTNLWYADITSDNRFLIIYGLFSDDQTFKVYMATLDQPFSEKMKFFSLIPSYKYSLQYLANIGNDFYFITNKDDKVNHEIVYGQIDPKKMILNNDLNKLKDELMTTIIIPQNEKWNIENWIILNKKKIILIYLEEAKYTFYLYDLITGQKLQQFLPNFIGKFYQSDYAPDRDQGFIEISTFTEASGIYKIRLISDDQVTVEPVLIGNPEGVDMSIFHTEQRFSISKDGTRVPFTMSYRKDYPFDGTQSAWLFFYGAFDQNTIEFYDPYMLPFVRDRNGIACYLSIRGGGEEGLEWWKDGSLEKRQNSFDDILSVINYLIDNKVVAEGKIIIEGIGAGGQAAMVVGNQAKEGLIGVIFPTEGIFDMLRINAYPNAESYTGEFGNPNTTKGFDFIYPWSPLNHVDGKKDYPALLFSPNQAGIDFGEGINSPAHSFKMTAELQFNRPKNTNPILLWIPDKFDEKYDINKYTFEQCFVNQVLGLKRL